MLFPTHRFLEIVITQDVSQVQSILHGKTLSRLFAGRLFVKEERQASMSTALQNLICAGLKDEKLQRKCLWCSLSYSTKLLHLHACWLLLICIWMVSGDRMQLAINVQIPVKLGGVGGHAIYIGMWSCIHENPPPWPPFLSLSLILMVQFTPQVSKWAHDIVLGLCPVQILRVVSCWREHCRWQKPVLMSLFLHHHYHHLWMMIWFSNWILTHICHTFTLCVYMIQLSNWLLSITCQTFWRNTIRYTHAPKNCRFFLTCKQRWWCSWQYFLSDAHKVHNST